MVRNAAGISAIALLLALGGCGGDGEEVSTETLGRYCELARQFDDLAVSTGASTAPGKLDGPPEAVTRLEAQMRPVLEELDSAAPEDVESDVGTTVDALREVESGDAAAVRSEEVTAALGRTRAFVEASCPNAATSGDG